MPAVVAALGDFVDFLDVVLSDVGDDELVRAAAIEAEAVGISPTVCEIPTASASIAAARTSSSSPTSDKTTSRKSTKSPRAATTAGITRKAPTPSTPPTAPSPAI